MSSPDWRNDPNSQEWARFWLEYRETIPMPRVTTSWEQMVDAVKNGMLVMHELGMVHSLARYNNEEVLIGEDRWGGQLYLRRRDVERTG